MCERLIDLLGSCLIRQVGGDLNVKYVLEDSIQSIDERIRMTAQLVEAASGSHVWSERYDRHAEDLFAVQNEVTQRIAATLSAASSSRILGLRGCVARGCPTTEHARRSETGSCERT